jgi:hypothetical protein
MRKERKPGCRLNVVRNFTDGSLANAEKVIKGEIYLIFRNLGHVESKLSHFKGLEESFAGNRPGTNSCFGRQCYYSRGDTFLKVLLDRCEPNLYIPISN